MDISVSELKKRLESGEKLQLLDVREWAEVQAGKLTDLTIPMGEVALNLDKLAHLKDQELIVYCRSGKRSGAIVQFLKGQGFDNVRNLTGGVSAWKAEADPTFVVG